MKENSIIEISMNDRLKRRIAFLLNNDQKCVTGSWIIDDEFSIENPHPENIQITNIQLYTALEQFVR